jgi:hypothetical protein
MVFGTRAFFGYVPDLEGGTAWFVNVPRHATSRAEREATTAEQWKRWLIDLVARDRGPAADLIAGGCLQLAADNTHDLPSVPVWHKAPLIIVGDGARAVSYPDKAHRWRSRMAWSSPSVCVMCPAFRKPLRRSNAYAAGVWNGSSRRGTKQQQ